MSNKIKPLEPDGLLYLLKKIYSKIAISSKNAKDSAKDYTDTKIANLINGAPETLDTLGEIATVMSDNKDVVDALDSAIGTKANQTDLTNHTSSTSNPHSVTKTQIGLGNVENKSSATIRGELTKENVTTALGFTPPTTNTTYNPVTTTVNGLMSKEDKSKLNGIEDNANNYSHPTYTAKSSGLYKVTVDSTGHISAATAVTKSDITDLGIPAQDTNTTYSTATQSTQGLMSANDKKKLDGIATSANNYTLPTASDTTLGGVKVGANIDLISGKISLSKANVVSALGFTPPTTNTTYSNFVKSGSGAKSGLVPAPSTTAGTTKYLREDGTWQVPPDNNTTYSTATTTANGLMSKEDKTKLNSLDLSTFSWGGKYTIPSGNSETVKIPLNGTQNKHNYCMLFIIGAYSALYFINFAAESRIELICGSSSNFTLTRTNAYEIGVATVSSNQYNHQCYVININTENA